MLVFVTGVSIKSSVASIIECKFLVGWRCAGFVLFETPWSGTTTNFVEVSAVPLSQLRMIWFVDMSNILKLPANSFSPRSVETLSLQVSFC